MMICTHCGLAMKASGILTCPTCESRARRARTLAPLTFGAPPSTETHGRLAPVGASNVK
jgi:tRNA(Ile2) C34 agmatinyltransferase TiaS